MVEIKMNVTVPDEIINDAQMRKQIEKALRTKTGPDIRRNFQKTTEGWTHKPSWSQKFTSRTNFLSISVWASGPNANQYGLVNAGSPAHRISARRGGLLRFQPTYRAATKPGRLSSRSPQRSGAFMSARSVNHPGFEGRRFDETVAKVVAPQFAKDIQEAVQAGARA
jgi:hypothetical protein